MNVYTFKDAATSKRQSLAHELETLDDREDDEDEEAEEGEGAHRAPAGAVEGEEDESGDKVWHKPLLMYRSLHTH